VELITSRSHQLVTLDDIRAAAGRIRDVAVRTPVLTVPLPSRDGRGSRPSGGPDPARPMLALKCENLQPMGAFKIRGACNMIAQLTPEARAAGVITFSSGNHGQAVALVARHFGIRAVVVMPTTASPFKIERVKEYGGEVILAGTTSLERKVRADAESAARGLTMVPPFDHPAIVAGAGTVGLEVLEQQPAATTVYVPVGGGGLIAGVSAAVKQMRPGVRVIGVEPEGAAKMSASIEEGHPVTLPTTASVADGLLPVRPGDLTYAHVKAFVDAVVTVTDAAIVEAMRWLFSQARVVAEPSGAATVAAALQAAASAMDEHPVAVISGGNIAVEDFTKLLSG
jgi:threo-3-hydroxy-L-aspartate ammonia-lyase